MGKTCVICGKPSGMYPLCREHLQMKNEGFIVKCEDCGQWHFVDTSCNCKTTVTYTELPTEGFEKCVSCGAKTNGYAFCKKCFKKYTNDEMLNILNGVDSDDEEDNEVSIYSEKYESSNGDELTCIICGKPSNGKHFCFSCWNTYKDKAIEIRIKNCKEVTITDNYGNKETKTANGLYVRSLSEKIIYEELFHRGIKCEYERIVPYKEKNGKIKELKPDFYLPDYKLYIEHWGYLDTRDKEYIKEKEYKEKIYKEKGYRLAATVAQDIHDIQAAISRIFLENDIEEK